MSAPLRSSLTVGTVRHRRVRPKPHAFTYRTWHALLDLDELDRLDADVVGFGYRRRGLATFRDTDHLGPLDLPVREKLARWLAGQGVELPGGPVLLHTNLRILGHVFNPVSWFLCHGADGRLELVVAEVDNTFGETHGYVLDELTREGPHRVTARATKVFHVSPFMDIPDHTYDFAFRPVTPAPADGELFAVHMDVSDATGRLFDATNVERRRPFTTTTLLGLLLRQPFMTLRTVAAIHWQALRIWVGRKARFHRKPTPPDTGFEAIARPRDASDRASA